VVGVVLDIAAGYANLQAITFARTLHAAGPLPYIEDPGWPVLFALPIKLVVASVVSGLLGVVALASPKSDRPLAHLAIAVNLLPLSFLIIAVWAYY
jgi:hypothetical protein